MPYEKLHYTTELREMERAANECSLAKWGPATQLVGPFHLLQRPVADQVTCRRDSFHSGTILLGILVRHSGSAFYAATLMLLALTAL